MVWLSLVTETDIEILHVDQIKLLYSEIVTELELTIHYKSSVVVWVSSVK